MLQRYQWLATSTSKMNKLMKNKIDISLSFT